MRKNSIKERAKKVPQKIKKKVSLKAKKVAIKDIKKSEKIVYIDKTLSDKHLFPNVRDVRNEQVVHEVKQEQIIPEVKNDPPPTNELPKMENTEIKTEISNTVVKPSGEVSGEIKTSSSASMLDDLMAQTDKDGKENLGDNEFEDSLLDDVSNDTNTSSQENLPPPNSSASGIGDKVHDVLTNEGDDWQNPSDFRKMCAVNAMLYVEGGAILLSFIGQMISGDWSHEGEARYSPSEERKKLIRAPLAKKFELNKDTSKRTPTGALITAIIFTVLPVIILAFKDRKKRIEIEQKNIENAQLKEQLILQQNEINALRNTVQPIEKTQIPKTTLTPFLVKKAGRHKKDCGCDKCNLKRLSDKKGKR